MFLFSALIAAVGALCNYLLRPFPAGFYVIIAIMGIATSVTVMFTLTGPPLSFPKRLSKAIVPSFFAFIGLSILVSTGTLFVRLIGEAWLDFDFTSDGFANGFGMVFNVFYPAVLLVMFITSGSQVAQYNDATADGD